MIDFIRSYATCIHNADAACLQVTFKGTVSLDEFVEVIATEFEMIRHYKLKKCLVNLRKSVYPVGGQELVKNVWFPQMIKEGIKILALVVSHNIFAKMSIHETRSPNGNLIINYFNDEGDALAWLVSQRL